MLGPGWIPPQGARALVRQLLRRGDGGGPNVAATLRDAPEGTVLELVNEGGRTAVDLRVVFAGGDVSVGHLPPGETVEARVPTGTGERIVWTCTDDRGRTRAWSYDGR